MLLRKRREKAESAHIGRTVTLSGAGTPDGASGTRARNRETVKERSHKEIECKVTGLWPWS